MIDFYNLKKGTKIAHPHKSEHFVFGGISFDAGHQQFGIKAEEFLNIRAVGSNKWIEIMLDDTAESWYIVEGV